MAGDAADDAEERVCGSDGNGASGVEEGADVGTPRVDEREKNSAGGGEEAGGGGEEGGGGPPVRTPGSFRALLNGIKAQQTPKTPRTSVGSEAFISLDLEEDARSSSTPTATTTTTTGKRGREDGGEEDGGGKRLSVPGDDFMSLDEFDAAGPASSSSAKKGGASSGSTATSNNAASTAYNKKSPWARGRSYQISSGDRTVSLHHEICDFIEFIQPVRAAIPLRPGTTIPTSPNPHSCTPP